MTRLREDDIGHIAQRLPEYDGRPYTLHLAREIIRLPQVELASHTLTHPFQWDLTRGTDATYTSQGY